MSDAPTRESSPQLVRAKRIGLLVWIVAEAAVVSTCLWTVRAADARPQSPNLGALVIMVGGALSFGAVVCACFLPFAVPGYLEPHLYRMREVDVSRTGKVRSVADVRHPAGFYRSWLRWAAGVPILSVVTNLVLRIIYVVTG